MDQEPESAPGDSDQKEPIYNEDKTKEFLFSVYDDIIITGRQYLKCRSRSTALCDIGKATIGGYPTDNPVFNYIERVYPDGEKVSFIKIGNNHPWNIVYQSDGYLYLVGNSLDTNGKTKRVKDKKDLKSISAKFELSLRINFGETVAAFKTQIENKDFSPPKLIKPVK